ncbi:NADH oxidase [Bifidobacterium saguini DSM 23967]|uniref:NADH oxidase n=1 Tax=Bifidobacterium saguini DSM 23967 TaxID=1437607 RepID=A0A087DEB0_9BIFI|nr:NADH oxidase [Bifidobacterium saguini DSM 23967]
MEEHGHQGSLIDVDLLGQISQRSTLTQTNNLTIAVRNANAANGRCFQLLIFLTLCQTVLTSLGGLTALTAECTCSTAATTAAATACGTVARSTAALEVVATDYIPLATNAVRQGLLVGRNIEKPTVKYMGTQATSAVQLYDLSLAASGLTKAGAERRGLTVHETELTEDYRPDFMLTTTPVTSILTWDPETRKVKGGQFCSKADISGAANVISMAIQAGFTIDQLANVDFLFQPNFDKPVYYVGAVAMKAAAEA